jgi:RNA 2',3'-cyclic 3'-phosphodiesterase
MRIFIALDIDDDIRQRIQRYQEGVSGFASEARWVRLESAHVTLKFIGEKPVETVEEIKRVLAGVRAEPFEITFRGYGFFPTAKAARVFWLGIESGLQLVTLAKSIEEATFTLGIPKESHAFSPHLTLARGGASAGTLGSRKGDAHNRSFQILQEKLAAFPTPEFGTMTSHEFYLYESHLSPGGSRYTKIATFALT